MTTDSVDVVIARLEGKVDRLGDKLDDKMDTVLARIDAGDREQAQKLVLTEERLHNNSRRIEELEKRVTNIGKTQMDIQKALQDDNESLDQKISDRLWKLEQFNAKLIGMSLGVGLISGGTVAAVMKAVGGA